jgi:hypothetical protein
VPLRVHAGSRPGCSRRSGGNCGPWGCPYWVWVFIWSGYIKARDPATFRHALDQTLQRRLGWLRGPLKALPGWELAVGIALVAGLFPVGVAVTATLTVASFASWTLWVHQSGRTVTCGCFGAPRNQPVALIDVVRNVLLACALGSAAIIDLHYYGLNANAYTDGIGLRELFRALPIVLVVPILWLNAGQLWRNSQILGPNNRG